jgi:diacylglycerol kinase family enzyme
MAHQLGGQTEAGSFRSWHPAKIPPDATEIVVAHNPIAGLRSAEHRVQKLAALLRSHGYEASVYTDLAEATRKANEAFAAGSLRALVGVGGDGTAFELINRTCAGLPITLLPAGNESLLARHLGLSASPEALYRTICAGQLRRLDAGRCSGRLFASMVSCGLDAEVVHIVHRRRRGHMGTRHYIKPIWEAIRTYRFPEIAIDIEHEDPAPGPAEALVARWCFVFNLPCYGGGLRICPQASGVDGLLDLCLFHRGGSWPGLFYAAAVAAGCHRALKVCTTRRVKRLRISSSQLVYYQIDGDPGGTLPVEVEVVPDRLTFIVPPDSFKSQRSWP